MRFLRVFLFFFSFGLAQAQPVSDPADGNQIPEPQLRDYQAANRSPGILVEPYDVVDAQNRPIDR